MPEDKEIREPFEVQVYMPFEVMVRTFVYEIHAFDFAFKQFKLPDVYKVKVWNLLIGDPVPGADEHNALILHLV